MTKEMLGVGKAQRNELGNSLSAQLDDSKTGRYIHLSSVEQDDL